MSEKEIKKVTFTSLKFKNLRVVLDPMTKKEVQGSLVASSIFGKFPRGFVAEFENGIFTTDDQLVIELMKENPYYGAMFVSSDKDEKVKIGDAGINMLNTRNTVADELASTCPTCGFKAKSKAGLDIHMRSHK